MRILEEINSLENIPTFEIETRPVFLENGRKMDGYNALVRNDTEDIFSVVKNSYRPIQLSEMIDVNGKAIDNLRKEHGIPLEPTGYAFINKGKRVLIQTRIADKLKYGTENFDAFIYTIIDNSGTAANKTFPSLTRIYCTNVLPRLSSTKVSKNSSVRHAHTFDTRIKAFEASIIQGVAYITRFEKIVEALRDAPFTPTKMRQLASRLYPTESIDSALKRAHTITKRDSLVGLFSDGRSVEGKTKWDAFNAVTETDTDNFNRRPSASKLVRMVTQNTTASYKALQWLTQN